MKLPEGYILKQTFFNENLYAVTHVNSSTCICYVTKNLGDKENASISFIQKRFNEDKYIELDDVPYRGVIFDERDPNSNTEITLDHYSKVFCDANLMFTIKCDDVRIEGECGAVDFSSENDELVAQKLNLKDVSDISFHFRQGFMNEIILDEVSNISLTIDKSVSDKFSMKMKNVRSSLNERSTILLSGNGVVSSEPSYVMNDLNFRKGVYKFNAPDGIFLGRIGIIRSYNQDKICEIDSRGQIRIDCKGITSGIFFDYKSGKDNLLRGKDIIIETVKDDFTFNIVGESVVMGDFYFNDGSGEYSKTKLTLENFEANSNVFFKGNSFDIKDCDIKTGGETNITIKDSLLAKCRVIHSTGSLSLCNATIKGFLLIDNVYNEKMTLINKCLDTYVSLRRCDFSKAGDMRIEYFGKDSHFRNIEDCEFIGKTGYIKFGDEGDVEMSSCRVRDAFTLLEKCVVKNSDIEGACDLVKTTIDDSTIIESSIKSVKEIWSSFINDCDIQNVSRIDSSFLDKENIKNTDFIEKKEGFLNNKILNKDKMVVNLDKSTEIEL